MAGLFQKLFARRRKARNVVDNGRGNVFANVPAEAKVVVFGNGNRVEFAEPGMHFGSWIHVGAADHPVNGAVVSVGRGTTSEECRMTLMEHGSFVRIGADCMISTGVEFLASDTHAVLDAQGTVVNLGRGISLGDHVWIGRNAALLKNVELPFGCIVGYGAVVSRIPGIAERSVVVGNPGAVVRTGACWDRRRPDEVTEGVKA